MPLRVFNIKDKTTWESGKTQQLMQRIEGNAGERPDGRTNCNSAALSPLALLTANLPIENAHFYGYT